jgi:hypothetical protein
MRIRKENLPLQINAYMTSIRCQLLEYLRLEDTAYFEDSDLQFCEYVTVGTEAFVLFEYPSEKGPGLGFLQFNKKKMDWQTEGCLGCWPIDPGADRHSAIKEYLEYNPPGRK